MNGRRKSFAEIVQKARNEWEEYDRIVLHKVKLGSREKTKEVAERSDQEIPTDQVKISVTAKQDMAGRRTAL